MGMHPEGTAKRAIVALVAVLALALVAFIGRSALARGGVTLAFDALSGTRISFDRLQLNAQRIDLTDVDVRSTRGEPIAAIPHLTLAYDLRDMLPGGSRMLGVRSFFVDRPTIYLIRRADGSYNIPFPKQRPQAQQGAPWIFEGHVRDGSIMLIDDHLGVPSARRLYIEGVTADANVATNARSRYRVVAFYREAGMRYPIYGRGDIDAGLGLGLQRWRAKNLPIAHIIDYALNSPSMHMAGGRLDGLDAQFATIVGADGAAQSHLAVKAMLRETRMSIGGLAKPIRALHGPIAVYDDGLTTSGLDGTLSDVPIHISGAIFGFTAAQFRLAVSAHGDAMRIRKALAQSASLPMRGPFALNMLVEGSASRPLELITLRSPAMTYGSTRFDDARTTVAFDGQEADLIDARATISGAQIDALGRLNIHPKRNAVEILAGAAVPSLPVRADALVRSDDLRHVATVASISDTSRSQNVGGLVAVGADGNMSGYVRGAHVALAKSGLSGNVDVISVLRGSVNNPRAVGVALIRDAHYQQFNGSASGTFAYESGALRLRDANADLGSAFAHARGTIGQSYDLDAQVRAIDVASFAQTPLTGSADADVHVSGALSSPAIVGALSVPEGSLNGLGFRALHANLSGAPGAVSLGNGHVLVGSTAVAFDAGMNGVAQQAHVVAPRADLADFNDYFDTGDMFAGRGSVALDATIAPGSVNSSGSLDVRDARLRNIALGRTTAQWSRSGSGTALRAAFGGPSGHVAVHGMLAQNLAMNLYASGRGIDTYTWLPMLGVVEPITGRIDADVHAQGRYPDLSSTLRADMHNGTLGRYTVQQLHIAAVMQAGRGRITSAFVRMPYLVASASGTFGMRPGDPMNLITRASISDIGAFTRTGTGKLVDMAGALDQRIALEGTFAQPRVRDDFVLQHARYGELNVPRAAGELIGDARHIALRGGSLNLERGRLLADASVPITLSPFALDPRNKPINGTLVADDVEASNFVNLLPKGTHMSGRLDGRIAVAGSMRAPQFAGGMTLARGSFSGPAERDPITDARAELAFAGTTATLRSLHARVGGGSVDGTGRASVPSVHDARDLSFQFSANATNARVDLPAYVKGRIDGAVSVARAPRSRTMISGNLALQNARIPLSALYNPSSGAPPEVPRPDVGFHLNVAAGDDVRVVSPNVDLGAQGAVAVGGTLASPTLAGRFRSTGGTLDFYRRFSIERGMVRFDPSSGIVPDVNAVARTYITEPDTDIVIHATGPATDMNLAFQSDPPYDRAQILGLLIGVGQQHGAFSASSEGQQLVAGGVNEIFTRNLLEPLSVALGNSLGFSDFQITNDVRRGLGVNAVRAFGKSANIVFEDTFNEPRRESVSLQTRPSRATEMDLTLYTIQSESLLAFAQQPVYTQGPIDTAEDQQLMGRGTNGLNFKLEKRFP